MYDLNHYRTPSATHSFGWGTHVEFDKEDLARAAEADGAVGWKLRRSWLAKRMQVLLTKPWRRLRVGIFATRADAVAPVTPR